MSFIRFHYDPLTEFDRLFDDAFDARFRPAANVRERSGRQQSTSFRPRIDVYEVKDSDVVTATFELPGLTAKDVTIDVHHSRLTVSGESASSNASEDAMYAVRERQHGKFTRVLQLPFGTKAEDVKATMENGLLTLTFPKVTPEQQAQRITIQEEH